MVEVLGLVRPGWANQTIWELAPSGPASAFVRDRCLEYVGTQYWPDLPSGASRDGVRCEDIECPSFDDASVDIVLCSDVFEHVFDVEKSLKEIRRVLADDGVLIWTVPRYLDLERSRERTVRREGRVEYLLEPEYHGDPVNDDGIIVTFDWGRDLADRVRAASGMTTASFELDSMDLGIAGEFREVFVTSAVPSALAPGRVLVPDLHPANRGASEAATFVQIADETSRLHGDSELSNGMCFVLGSDSTHVVGALRSVGVERIVSMDTLDNGSAELFDGGSPARVLGALELFSGAVFSDFFVVGISADMGTSEHLELAGLASRLLRPRGLAYLTVEEQDRNNPNAIRQDVNDMVVAAWRKYDFTVIRWIPSGILFGQAMVVLVSGGTAEADTAGPSPDGRRGVRQWFASARSVVTNDRGGAGEPRAH